MKKAGALNLNFEVHTAQSGQEEDISYNFSCPTAKSNGDRESSFWDLHSRGSDSGMARRCKTECKIGETVPFQLLFKIQGVVLVQPRLCCFHQHKQRWRQLLKNKPDTTQMGLAELSKWTRFINFFYFFVLNGTVLLHVKNHFPSINFFSFFLFFFPTIHFFSVGDTSFGESANSGKEV